VQGGFQQSATGADSRGELPFQFVAHGHKFVYFGDDAVLFGEEHKKASCSIGVHWSRNSQVLCLLAGNSARRFRHYLSMMLQRNDCIEPSHFVPGSVSGVPVPTEPGTP
jgi:hypothetical protein